MILQGLKVVDISSVLAGPLTGTFLAEQGAKVIKVENKTTGGDVTRQWKQAGEDPQDSHSAYYFSANFGKEVHFLDLTLPSDMDWLMSELQETDVVISNFQKKTAEKLGLTHPSFTVTESIFRKRGYCSCFLVSKRCGGIGEPGYKLSDERHDSRPIRYVTSQHHALW